MNTVSHSGQLRSAHRRFRRRRYGGAPGQSGPWFSWDTQHPEECQWSEYPEEHERWWSELDVHVHLAWSHLLPGRLFGSPVLSGGDPNELTSTIELPTTANSEAGPSGESRVSHSEDFPAVLAEYSKLLHDDSGESLKLLRANIPWVLTTPEGRFFRQLAKHHLLQDPDCSHAGMIVSLLHLRPFWIRPLATWSHANLGRPDWIESLVNHLLVQFPVPKFIHREVWASRYILGSGFLEGKAAIWFILAAQGVSLHRAAAHFDWVVPKGLVHWIAQAPEELSLPEATLWAEVMRLGGSTVEFDRLQRYHGFRMDLTGGDVNQKSCLRPLRETIRWLANHRDELTDETCAVILEWYAHEFTEIQAGRPGASMKGRSVRGALTVARAYVAERSRPYRAVAWLPHGWDWETTGPDGDRWAVRELTTGLELYEEGIVLRHCVVGYASRCAEGETAIFSVGTNGKRRLTIEISLPARKVIQVRGVCNRPATPEEQQVVRQWCAEVVNGIVVCW